MGVSLEEGTPGGLRVAQQCHPNGCRSGKEASRAGGVLGSTGASDWEGRQRSETPGFCYVTQPSERLANTSRGLLQPQVKQLPRAS